MSALAQNVMTKAPRASSVSTLPPVFSNLSSYTGRSASSIQQSYTNSMASMSSSASMPRAARFGNTSSLASKPFSAYTSQPTVSPYLNLFRVDLNGNNDFNYSTLVRPQLQQQQVNQQLERQNLQNARRLQAIAAQPDFNPQGSKDEYPTGHQTVFNYMGHYYPTTRPTKQRSQ
ncbi:MAG: hypothetical protein U0805_16555 [Pirellulales bacterium]